MMMMAIQKILLSVVSKFVVGVCDGLDACEISRPEILPQSAPVYGLILLPNVESRVGRYISCDMHAHLVSKAGFLISG